MPTSTHANRPRDGRGRFRRGLAHIERDAEAARLICEGWTYQQAADHLGYSDRGTCYRSVQRVLVETAWSQDVEELRVQQVAEMAELRRVMWGVVRDPPPLTDRLGRIVKDDDGAPVPDEQARSAAAMAVIRAGERTARLKGLDAPKRQVTVTMDMVRARIAELRAGAAAGKVLAGEALTEEERAALGAGPAVPGAVEAPQARP